MSELYLIDKPKSSFFTDLENAVSSILDQQVDGRFYIPYISASKYWYLIKDKDSRIRYCIENFKEWINNIEKNRSWDYEKYSSVNINEEIRNFIKIFKESIKSNDIYKDYNKFSTNEKLRLNFQDLVGYNKEGEATWIKKLWEELIKLKIIKNDMPEMNLQKRKQFSYSVLKYFFTYELEWDKNDMMDCVEDILFLHALRVRSNYDFYENYIILKDVEHYIFSKQKCTIYIYKSDWYNFSAEVIDKLKSPPIDFFNSEIKPALETLSHYIIEENPEAILNDQILKEFFHTDLLKILAFIAHPIKFLEMF